MSLLHLPALPSGMAMLDRGFTGPSYEWLPGRGRLLFGFAHDLDFSGPRATLDLGPLSPPLAHPCSSTWSRIYLQPQLQSRLPFLKLQKLMRLWGKETEAGVGRMGVGTHRGCLGLENRISRCSPGQNRPGNICAQSLEQASLVKREKQNSPSFSV